jgi:hypothetical protein
MSKLKIQIDNEIREMTNEEHQAYLAYQAEQEQLLLGQESKKVARESALAKLAALGLTEEEIAAL